MCQCGDNVKVSLLVWRTRYTDTFCNAVDCRFELELEVHRWTMTRSECLPGAQKLQLRHWRAVNSPLDSTALRRQESVSHTSINVAQLLRATCFRAWRVSSARRRHQTWNYSNVKIMRTAIGKMKQSRGGMRATFLMLVFIVSGATGQYFSPHLCV